MHMCHLYAWLARVSVGLALVLSSCLAQAGRPAPPSTPVPPTTAPPVTSPPVLRVGTTPQYPPLTFTQQGHVTGLEVECARGVAAELGRRVEVVELAWEALIPALEAGQIDVIMSGMSITEARARRVWFVSPYLRTGQVAIFRKGDELQFSAPALLTLTQRRVGFVAETTGAAYVHGHLPQAQHVPLGSADAGLQALRAGDIDVFVHDAVTAWRVGNNAANDTLMSSFTPLTEEYLAWAVRPTDDALHRDLEAVLARWTYSGHLQALFHKWLTFRVE